ALKQVSEVPRRPSELNPAVPRALDAVVLKALAKDPANRFGSADEFVAALDAAEANPAVAPFDTAVFSAVPVAAPDGTEVRGAPPEGPPEGPEDEERGRRRWKWVVLGVLALALIAVAVWALTRPGHAAVPAVIGGDVETATATLEDAGFEVDTTEFPSSQRRGTVVEQDPRAGEEAEEGSTVVLSVSAGPGTAKVPDVSGLPETRAAKRLDEAGFRPDSRERFSNDVPAGRVIATRPEAGTRLERDSVVTLLVSKGSDLVEVPSVLGLQQEDAEADIDAADLLANVETENSEEPEGTVIAQDPGPGGAVERGSEVTIAVSTGAGSVVVSSVIGDSKDAARATLRAQGLKVTARNQDVSSPDDDGVVLEQAPSGGSRVPRGTTVTLVVGRFVETGGELGEGD
ncbi:MAG: PASTA domain-containing protein, partial [Solirubrobacterales bacterium]